MTRKVSSKEVLTAAASRLFRLRGYYGVGLNDIIEESGIPKGSLYYYFPGGKEELAIEAINHSKKIVMNEIQTVFERIEDPVKAIQSHIYQLSEVLEKDGNFSGLPIGTIAGEKHSTNEAIRLACLLAFQDWQSIYVKKFLATGFNEQQSNELSIIINALIEGGILLSLTEKSGKPLQIIAKQVPLLLIKE